MNKNAIYTGKVRHRRFAPVYHEFSYSVFMMYCDVTKVEDLCKKSVFWSYNKHNIASFYEKDYLPSRQGDLFERVNQVIVDEGFESCKGSIYLLSNWRYFGYLINPISTYFCYDDAGQLQYKVLEVTNTPWEQRQVYVLKCDPEQAVQRIRFNKMMHVSPFYPMDMTYHLRSRVPDEILSMHLENHQHEEKKFDATLALEYKEANGANLTSILWQYPAMTFKVLWGIYWQALKLWVKGVPYIPNPEAGDEESLAENTMNK